MLNHSGTAVITTKRLRLRPYCSSDAQAMFDNWASDERVTKYMTWQPHKDVSVTQGLIDMWVEGYVSSTVYRWAIELDHELVGDISVVKWQEDDAWCEIGYCLAPKCWNQGIMTEALEAVLAYLFDTVGFHRVQLRHDSNNPASGRVMQKCGMQFEGVHRGAVRRRDGSWADICVYGMLGSDRK